MVRLTIKFETEGVPFDWDVGGFVTREEAEGAASMIRQQADDADEDVEFLGYRIEAVGGTA